MIPEDIEAFWGRAWEEVRTAPLDFHRSLRSDYPLDGFRVERLEFSSVGGQRLSGWIALPEGASRAPGFVWVPPYGRESLLPNRFGTRPGMVSLSLNLHGLDAFHQEKYHPSRGYFSEGVGEPETYIFRTLWQHAAMAVRVLQAQIEVDEDRLGAMGMSQGGGMSIWLGAWCPLVKAVCADMPFLGKIEAAFDRPIHRYPLKELIDFVENEPLGHERVRHTLSYFDTSHQAAFCRVPTHVSLGLKDPAAKPESVRAIYEALAGEKDLVEYDWGHDWHPEMVSRNQNWLLQHF